MRLHVGLVLIVCIASTAHAAEADWQTGLGRLFVTPQKRALLDELRRSNARMDTPEQLDSVRLDGIVRRSSGKQTIWINGQSYNDRAPVTRNFCRYKTDAADVGVAVCLAKPKTL